MAEEIVQNGPLAVAQAKFAVDRGLEGDLQTGLDIVGYSLMVFSAGMGFVAGSLILTFIAKHIGTKWLIGIGRFLSAFGYLIYALAPNFYWALGGLIILGLFGAMASIGFTTYIQNQVPLSMMGRINNVIGFFQQGLSIVFILAGGFLVSEYGIRILMVCTTILMLILSIILTGMILTEKRNSLFKDEIK
ncbi:MFS transporter [Thermicanus aegyptius]|uniref:MFS transporter n=1 Tax=Thermicanus aegyptius TaxID=94009 RepID=UPI00048D10DD|nr:MFS transporter [Thermicanus aegyptius]